MQDGGENGKKRLDFVGFKANNFETFAQLDIHFVKCAAFGHLKGCIVTVDVAVLARVRQLVALFLFLHGDMK